VNGSNDRKSIDLSGVARKMTRSAVVSLTTQADSHALPNEVV